MRGDRAHRHLPLQAHHHGRADGGARGAGDRAGREHHPHAEGAGRAADPDQPQHAPGDRPLRPHRRLAARPDLRQPEARRRPTARTSSPTSPAPRPRPSTPTPPEREAMAAAAPPAPPRHPRHRHRRRPGPRPRDRPAAGRRGLHPARRSPAATRQGRAPRSPSSRPPGPRCASCAPTSARSRTASPSSTPPTSMGGANALVNAAAACDRGGLLDTTPAIWATLMDTNARGPFFVMQRFARAGDRARRARRRSSTSCRW